MKNLCVCIPTYNRPDAIEKVLNKEIALFEKYSVDVIVFDSSDNKETEVVVEKFIKEGYKNLSIKKYDPKIKANEKVFLLYEDMMESTYDYIWMIHDHTVCNEEAVIYILQQFELEGDFYLLKMQSGKFETSRITRLDDFLMKGAWILNSFGTAILNRKTFLKGTNWEKISQKYLTPQKLNYSHIGLYYERISDMKEPSIIQLEFSRECFLDFMRYEKPSWENEAVRICFECWGNVLMSLPAEYTNKKEVLRTQDKWFMSKYNLLEYKKNGRFNLAVFLTYKKWIKRIMPENYANAFWIAVLPYRWAKYKYTSKLLREIERKRREGRKICLYGAGRHAFECYTYLQKQDVRIDSYLVSRMEGNPKQINGCPVYQADEYLKNNSAFIIIAVLTSGVSEVTRYLTSFAASGADIDYTGFEL